MAGYVNCPYTPDEWRDILKSTQSQLLQMQLAVSDVRKMERRAAAATPGYDIFPIDDDANAAMQTVMNSKWGNILGDIGSAASLALFRYKYLIAAGRPAAYLTATISDYSVAQSKIVANAGEPFTKAYGHATQGDRISVGWTQSDGVARLVTGLFVENVATANTLRVTTMINPELVINGQFGEDDHWTKGEGWTIGGGDANAAGALDTALSSTAAIAVVGGRRYTLSFDMTRAAGTLTPSFDGVPLTARALTGSYTEDFSPADASGVLAFTGAGFTGTLDNVFLREIVPSVDATVTVELEATYVP